ncbi:MAG: hypothetical protein MUF87_12085 [Anaerolineae bacterium]|jgi:hypothetical protein|nr:hypothetical protein [Anaerolineae bacterium]
MSRFGFWAVLIAILGASITFTQAQTWPVVQNCMGDLTYPIVAKGNWQFSGVITSYLERQGVWAARGDRNVEYFIAQQSDNSHSFAGGFSPDGVYYAFPTGGREVNTAITDWLIVRHIAVVRTDGLTDESYRHEANYADMIGSDHFVEPIGALPLVYWIDQEWLFYENERNEVLIWNFRTDETRTWEQEVNAFRLAYPAPTWTRIFADHELYDLETDTPLGFFRLPQQTIVWQQDSSAFLAPTETEIQWIDQDGAILDFIPLQAAHLALAPNDRWLAVWDQSQQLLIADLDNQLIYDLCFTWKGFDRGTKRLFPNLAWSPDGATLAFNYDGFLVLLDLATLTNQVIDHRPGWITDWLPLEGETISLATIEIRPPEAAPTATSTITPNPPTVTPTPFLMITATPGPTTCALEVIAGANLRAGPGVNTEKLGSAAIGFQLVADGVQFNQTEYFRWWRLTTGEWIREDFVREDSACDSLPVIPPTE